MSEQEEKMECVEERSQKSKEMEDSDEKMDNMEIIEENKEQKQLSLMRLYVESHDPTSKEVDDLMLRRFLRARNLNVEKSSALFLKYLKWRRTFVPKGHISQDEVPTEIAQNKAFCGGVDKQGRPIVLVYGAKHFQNTNLDEFKRFVVYIMDKLCSRMAAGQEQFIGIGDLQGWGYKNCDIRGYISALSIMQDCYPERLGKILIVHAPRIFMTAWKIVYPFIDNKTRTKIAFVENTKLKSTLLEDIDESQVPDVYGGRFPLVPIQDDA